MRLLHKEILIKYNYFKQNQKLAIQISFIKNMKKNMEEKNCVKYKKGN